MNFSSAPVVSDIHKRFCSAGEHMLCFVQEDEYFVINAEKMIERGTRERSAVVNYLRMQGHISHR